MPEELNKKEQLSNTSDFNFLSNNVKGLQSSKKRLKLFQYFKNKISPKDILFLQETHPSKVTEKIYSHEFNGGLFFFTWENTFLLCFNWFLWQYQLFC